MSSGVMRTLTSILSTRKIRHHYDRSFAGTPQRDIFNDTFLGGVATAVHENIRGGVSTAPGDTHDVVIWMCVHLSCDGIIIGSYTAK